MDDDRAADQNAPTRTVAPADPDADRTRSSADGLTDTADPEAVGAQPDATPRSRGTGQPRLPAPLQYRDPDRYEVIAEHGRGGLGRVLRARDRELGRSVAIKELLEPTKTSELRFFREALITARLEHPGIAPVHEAGRWPDGTPFYAMKLVAGRPLKELIDEAPGLEQRLALLPHVVAVADAVAYAHSKGIIHRDLKPANVIVGDFGETVVIDWGLAKSITDSSDDETSSPASPSVARDVTGHGGIVGTPAYMSPEQAAGKPVGVDADIYSLGALLQHLVTGRTPTPGSAAPPSSVSRELWAIVARARHVDPKQRYQSAEALSADLRCHLRGQRVAAHRYTRRERFWRWVSKRRAAVVATVVASVAIASGSLLALRTSLRERDRARAASAETSRARAVAEQERDRAVFANAVAQLVQDPTAALDVLRGYGGSDPVAAALLAAQARARRPAVHVLTPTTSVVGGAANDALTTVVVMLKRGGVMPFAIWNPQRGIARTIPESFVSEAMPAVSPDGTLVALPATTGIVLRAGHDPYPVVAAIEMPTPRWVWFSATELCWSDRTGIDCAASARPTDVLASKQRIFDGPIDQLVFSRNGESVVFCSGGAAQVHAQHRTSPLGACKAGYRIEVSPSGRVAAIHAPTPRVQLWSSAGQLLGEVAATPRSITAVLDSPPAIAAAAADRGVTVTGADGVVRRLAPTIGRPSAISTAGSGDSFTIGDDIGTLTTYSATTGASAPSHRQSRAIRGVMPSLSQPMAITMTFDDLRIWPTEDASAHRSICDTALFHAVTSDDAVYMDDSGGHLHRLDKASGLTSIVATHESSAFGLAMSADQQQVASAGSDSTIVLHSDRPPATRILRPSSIPRDLLYVDSSLLVSAHENGEILAWHDGSSRTVHTHGDKAYRLALHPGRHHVASTSVDTTVAVHDVASMRTIAVLREAAGATSRAAYAGDMLWVSSHDGHVRGYDAASEYRLSADISPSTRPAGHLHAMDNGDIAATWEGGLLAVASNQGAIKLSMEMPKQQISALAARGSLLAVATDDGYVYLFDVARRSVAAVWSSAEGVTRVGFDGKHLLTTGRDGYLRRYLPPDPHEFISMDSAGLHQFLRTRREQTMLSVDFVKKD